jgi:hypothetical protein
MIQYISNKIIQEQGQATEADNTRGCLTKERKEKKGKQKEKQAGYIVYRFQLKLVHLQPLGCSFNIQ